jgi:hypothetical protein
VLVSETEIAVACYAGMQASLRTLWGKIPLALRVALALFFCVRLPWLLIVGAFAARFSPYPGWTGMPALDGPDWAQNWQRWDSGWYVRIIRDGYVASRCGHPGEVCTQASIAFLPAYPMSVRALMHTGLSLSLAAFLLNSVLLILSLWGLQRLAALTLGKEAAARIAWVVLAFPTSLFFSAGYSEGLFLCAAVWATVLLIEQHAVAVAVLVPIAALTRPYGVVFALCFLVGCMLRKRTRAAVLSGLTLVLSYSAYIAWQKAQFDDPFAFFFARRAWGFEGSALDTFTKYAGRTVGGEIWFSGGQDFLAIALVLVTAAWSYRKLGADLALFCLLLGLVPLSQGQVWGLSRGVLGAFPIFLMLSSFGARVVRFRLVAAAGFVLGSVNAFLFVRGVFVA